MKQNQAQAISISQLLDGDDFTMKVKQNCDFYYFVVAYSGLASSPE